MKKKEITLETIASSVDTLAKSMLDMKNDMRLMREENMKMHTETKKETAEQIRDLKNDMDMLASSIGLLRLDSTQFRKELNLLDERTLDIQEDIRIILELAKGNDGRLGYFQLAHVPTPH